MLSFLSLPEFALFEDRHAAPGQPTALLFDSLQEYREAHDLDSLQIGLNWLADSGLWGVLALDYELGSWLEPGLGLGRGEEARARLWGFQNCRELTADAVTVFLADSGEPAGIGGLNPGLDEAAYRVALGRIQDYIRAGDCYQVNFTFPLDFEYFGSPLALYRLLRERQPVRYGGLVSQPDGGLVSLSPELFVERRGQRLTTRPMKGTAARQRNLEADAAAATALAACSKNRAENLMIVDLLRNDLGRLARPGSIEVTSLFAVETYPSVHQMVSQVEAEVPEQDDFQLLQALFPCGSITGAPKIRAMQIIRELEFASRGIYTGSLGWRSPKGDLRLNVAIRTLELGCDGQGRMGVGSGIVADSDPGAEWQECLLKARFLTDLDPGLELIETLRLEVVGGVLAFSYLERHRQRMEKSAAWLGFSWTWAAMEEALFAGREALAEGVYRLRLAMNKAGRFNTCCVCLDPEPEGRRLLMLSALSINAHDPLRRHKTTARDLYDQALGAIADRPEVFDVLFLNQGAQVAEGARSNIFARINGCWLTPPLASGALPGILRAELLATGQVREAELSLEDLGRAEEIRCGNALRGWIPVFLVENGLV